MTGKEMTMRTTIKDLEYFVSVINEKIGVKEYGIGHYMLGQAYEYLIKHFADLTNKKAGELTPAKIYAKQFH